MTQISDTKTTIAELKAQIEKYMQDRDWEQFHSPKNMSMTIVREATELMELFLWVENQESYKVAHEKRLAVEHEIADVAITLLELCRIQKIDLAQAVTAKLAESAKKYPVEKCKGKFTKYNEL